MCKKIISNTYYVCIDNDLRETKLNEINVNEIFLFYGSNSIYDNFIAYGVKQNRGTKIIEINYQSVGSGLNNVKDIIKKINFFKQQNHE